MTPRKGSSSGMALSASSDPPGRTGASQSSQSTHKKNRQTSDTTAQWRSTGFSFGSMLLLSPEQTPTIPDEPATRAAPGAPDPA